eukprot:314934-Amphidinium_carterae.1
MITREHLVGVRFIMTRFLRRRIPSFGTARRHIVGSWLQLVRDDSWKCSASTQSAQEQQVLHFGQTPPQVFKEPHLERERGAYAPSLLQEEVFGSERTEHDICRPTFVTVRHGALVHSASKALSLPSGPLMHASASTICCK